MWDAFISYKQGIYLTITLWLILLSHREAKWTRRREPYCLDPYRLWETPSKESTHNVTPVISSLCRGWRVGYLAYHNQALGTGGADLPSLADQLLKVQDTTIICPPQLSQHVALAALSQEGTEYVEKQIRGLEGEWVMRPQQVQWTIGVAQGYFVFIVLSFFIEFDAF